MASGSRALRRFQDPREPLPFEHLFAPLVLNAREELRRQVDPDAYELLTPAAYEGWERYLFARLVSISEKAAYWQFAVFKTVTQAFWTPSVTAAPSDGVYRAFVGSNPAERLHALIQEFPGLKGLHHLLIETWRSAVAEFVNRLAKDRHKLGSQLNLDGAVGKVIAIEAGLSDPHHGGRCVARVTFENGEHMIYKPRSVAVEDHFSKLTDQINRYSIPYKLKSALCWDRDEFGWMENIFQKPANSVRDIHSFYWRAGALLCLIYLAQGVDIHQQNLIADGEFPVLIDLETLGHPQEHSGSEHFAQATSILRTGFLPNSGSTDAYRSAALSLNSSSDAPRWGWSNINRDDMTWELTQRSAGQHHYLPTFSGHAYPANGFVADIQAGFRWLGERLLADQKLKDGFRRWLVALANCHRRQLIRSSAHYLPVWEKMTSPAVLRSANSLDELRFVAADTLSELHPVEITALKQLDVPYINQVRGEDSPVRVLLQLTKEVIEAQLRILEELLP